jgi:hypothetical protein
MRWDTDVDVLMWAHEMIVLEVYTIQNRNTSLKLVLHPDWRYKFVKNPPTNGGPPYLGDGGRNYYPLGFTAPCARLYYATVHVDVWCMYADDHSGEDGVAYVGKGDFKSVQILAPSYDWLSIPREWLFPLQPCFLDGILLNCPAQAGGRLLQEIYNADVSDPDYLLDQATGCYEPKGFLLCGGHAATKCSECSQGHGMTWCNGQCQWNDSTGECLDKRKAVKKGIDQRKGTISCGGHSANKCSECPQEHGMTWCNGQCQWDNSMDECLDRSRSDLRFLEEEIPRLKALRK